MLHRAVIFIGFALALAACPKAPPASQTVDNATAVDGEGACPILEAKAAPEVNVAECVRGELIAALDAPAEAPSCHRLVPASEISGLEQVVVPEYGLVTLEHGGCAHWTLTLRFAMPGDGRTSPDAIYFHAAEVLLALPMPADDERLGAIAGELQVAAAAAMHPITLIPLGEPITVTDGFEYVTVSVADGQIVVADDIAL